MKANAPEKIYIHPTLDNLYGMCERSCDNDIEYTRTDVIIEKVESFLNRKDDRDSYTIGYIRRHLEEIIKEVGL